MSDTAGSATGWWEAWLHLPSSQCEEGSGLQAAVLYLLALQSVASPILRSERNLICGRRQEVLAVATDWAPWTVCTSVRLPAGLGILSSAGPEGGRVGGFSEWECLQGPDELLIPQAGCGASPESSQEGFTVLARCPPCCPVLSPHL